MNSPGISLYGVNKFVTILLLNRKLNSNRQNPNWRLAKVTSQLKIQNQKTKHVFPYSEKGSRESETEATIRDKIQ